MRRIRSYDEQLLALSSLQKSIEKADTFRDLKKALADLVSTLIQEQEEIVGTYQLSEVGETRTNYGPYSGDHLFEDAGGCSNCGGEGYVSGCLGDCGTEGDSGCEICSECCEACNQQ